MTPFNLTLQPAVLRWARERRGLDLEVLAKKLKVEEEAVASWEKTGEIKFSKIIALARVTNTPEGFLYLNEPPRDELPIPDFRTVGNEKVQHPSPDLLETIEDMQRRQNWMREYMQEEGEEPLPFVGSASLNQTPASVADDIRNTLGLDIRWASQISTWRDAIVVLRKKTEEARIITVTNGVVGNNTKRKLNSQEFRGFALVDDWAPLIFVNGSDFEVGKMFTLAHELVHVWLGRTGVSQFTDDLRPTENAIERFCNETAAEFLVPASELLQLWPKVEASKDPFQELARLFKVGTLVIARRSLDLGLISAKTFRDFYKKYATDERRLVKPHRSGGHFWNTQLVRVGRLFGNAVAQAVKDGRLEYQDAYQLTNMYGATFDKFVIQIQGLSK